MTFRHVHENTLLIWNNLHFSKMVSHVYNSGTGQTKTGGLQSSVAGQPSQTDELQAHQETLFQKKIQWRAIEEDTQYLTSDFYPRMCTNAATHCRPHISKREIFLIWGWVIGLYIWGILWGNYLKVAELQIEKLKYSSLGYICLWYTYDSADD